LIITGTGGIWLIARRRRRERTEKVSSAGVRMEMMNNNKEKEEYHFTPKKVLIYCLIVGSTSAIFSIFIDGLRLLSMAAFVFASITIWYMFG
jgi:preprotein translocase subunit Sec61beta